MLDRPRRGLARGRSDRRGSALEDDDPAGAGNLGGAADRPEVLWVLDLIEGEDEALPIVRLEEGGRIRVGVGIDLGDDALVLGRAAQPLKLLGRRLRRPPYPVDAPAAALRLGDRAAPVDEIAPALALRRGHRSALPNEPGAAGLIADLPAQPGELVADHVGALEVLAGPRLLALGEQTFRLRGRRLVLAQQGVEAEQRQELLERAAGAGQLTLVALGDDLEQGGEGLRGVEVVGERRQ